MKANSKNIQRVMADVRPDNNQTVFGYRQRVDKNKFNQKNKRTTGLAGTLLDNIHYGEKEKTLEYLNSFFNEEEVLAIDEKSDEQQETEELIFEFNRPVKKNESLIPLVVKCKEKGISQNVLNQDIVKKEDIFQSNNFFKPIKNKQVVFNKTDFTSNSLPPKQESIFDDKLNNFFQENFQTDQLTAENNQAVNNEKDLVPTYLPEKIIEPSNTGQKKRSLITFQRTKIFFGGLFSGKMNNNFSHFVLASFVLGGVLLIGAYSIAGWQLKDQAEEKSQEIITSMLAGKIALGNQDYFLADKKFHSAEVELSKINKQIETMTSGSFGLLDQLPFFSKLSNKKNLAQVAENLAQAGRAVTRLAQTLNKIKNPFDYNASANNQSLVEVFTSSEKDFLVVRNNLVKAEEEINKIKIASLPEETKDKIIKIKTSLPIFIKAIDNYENNSHIFLELLGYYGPRKYLLLFQNNYEMRATGGFIGSYGLLQVNNGKINDFKIEGIYHPDGQLTEKVVPPRPIQKISTAWSTHDANWFPDWRISSQKIAWFYEKTGGPTVDGTIALTPEVIKKMLILTGPIEMKDYGKVITAKNFDEEIRASIDSVDEKNQKTDTQTENNDPKKILADLAPKILNKLFSTKDPLQAIKLLKLIKNSLDEKHILLYSANEELEKKISTQGWSGEVLKTDKDYLMVINSNINGFKTDGVIDQKVEHFSEIQPNGEVIDTVKITRIHRGGHTGKEEFDKVNADYMRVYVPRGSKLIAVEGQTRELNEPPLDYVKLGFKEDPLVKQQEDSMMIDFNSGTRIYSASDKTVFANWTYVSPGETVVLKYKYKLPFKFNLEENFSYSTFYQKQSGSIRGELLGEIKYPSKIKPVWLFPQKAEQDKQQININKKFNRDVFLGVVFQKIDK